MELRDLKLLLDNGALTQGEFADSKGRLLRGDDSNLPCQSEAKTIPRDSLTRCSRRDPLKFPAPNEPSAGG